MHLLLAELVAEYENVTATGPNSIILMSDTTQPAINGITNEDTAFAGRNYTLIWVRFCLFQTFCYYCSSYACFT